MDWPGITAMASVGQLEALLSADAVGIPTRSASAKPHVKPRQVAALFMRGTLRGRHRRWLGCELLLKASKAHGAGAMAGAPLQAGLDFNVEVGSDLSPGKMLMTRQCAAGE